MSYAPTRKYVEACWKNAVLSYSSCVGALAASASPLLWFSHSKLVLLCRPGQTYLFLSAFVVFSHSYAWILVDGREHLQITYILCRVLRDFIHELDCVRNRWRAGRKALASLAWGMPDD